MNPAVNFPQNQVEQAGSIVCYAAEPVLRGSNILVVGAA
jgi:hypothetical protein